jgi:copper(I)-binding protein
MNKLFTHLALFASLIITPLASASEVTVTDAWIREAPPVSKVQAAYMNIRNSSDKDIVLTAASSPLFSRIEFHRTENDNGVMRMLQENSLSIPANNEIHLQPDGVHMMLFNPRQALKAGDKVPFTLTFSDQRQLDVILIVKKATAAAHHHHHHDHHE